MFLHSQFKIFNIHNLHSQSPFLFLISTSVPVMQAPEGLVSHDIKTAEELGPYVQSALNVISPGKVSRVLEGRHTIISLSVLS